MNNLKKFETEAEYQAWKDGDDYVFPNICKVGEEVVYNNYPEPFWIEALEDLTFSSESNNLISPYYSYDKLNWYQAYSVSRVLRSGQKVYFKSDVGSPGNAHLFKLKVSGRFNVGGSLLSICYDSDYLNYLDYNFSDEANMKFSALQGSKVVNAKELVLPLCNKYNAYYFDSLFSNCSLLVSSPRIPKLDDTMVNNLFSGCTSLKDAPTLKGNYWSAKNLFYGCSSLSFIKDLTVGNRYDPRNWVEGVSPTGTFIANSKRTDFTRGVSGIPEGWDLYLYDEDNDRYVVKFKVNGIPYEYYTDKPRDVTWEEFIDSEYNTNGFTYLNTAGTKFRPMFNNEFILYNNKVLNYSDNIILNATYTVGQPTETTTEEE